MFNRYLDISYKFFIIVIIIPMILKINETFSLNCFGSLLWGSLYFFGFLFRIPFTSFQNYYNLIFLFKSLLNIFFNKFFKIINWLSSCYDSNNFIASIRSFITNIVNKKIIPYFYWMFKIFISLFIIPWFYNLLIVMDYFF